MSPKSKLKINDVDLFHFFYEQLIVKDSSENCGIPIFCLRKDTENGEKIKLQEDTEKILIEANDSGLITEQCLHNLSLKSIIEGISKKINERKEKRQITDQIKKLESRFLSLNEIFAILCCISNVQNVENEKIKSQIILSQKLKIRLLESLWSIFIRRSIELLRDYDNRDKGEYKEDLGLVSLTEYFDEYSKFEELLFGADDFQREHILHVFRVYLLGISIVCNDKFLSQKILDSKEKIRVKAFDILTIPSYDLSESGKNVEIQSLLRKKVENKKKEQEDKGVKDAGSQLIEELEQEKLQRIKEKFAIWTIIALTHDLGYPLEKLDKINLRVLNMMKFFGTSNYFGLRYNLPLQGQFLNDYILKYISSKLRLNKCRRYEYIIQIQSKYYTKFSNAFEKLSHGIVSCILLMKNLTYFLESDYSFPEVNQALFDEDACQFLIRREMLRAIASHDCDDIYHINATTFSFLLIICDELQEWDRPYAKERVGIQANSNVSICEFSENKIEFIIEFDQHQSDFIEIVKRKVKRFIRLFRSAVNSDKRHFSLKMWLVKGSFVDLPASIPEKSDGLEEVCFQDIEKAIAIIVTIPEAKIPEGKKQYPGPDFIMVIKKTESGKKDPILEQKKVKPRDLFGLD